MLSICFLQGAKLFQAAARLGLSERQLTRERTRALGLLKDELHKNGNTSAKTFVPTPIPAIRGFLPRPGQAAVIDTLLEKHRLVNVSGPPGMGKTSLVAEIARTVKSSGSVLWYRFRPGINITLTSILLEVGDYLASEGRMELSNYLSKALPEIDAAVATRLALQGLADSPHLLVFDDFHLVNEDATIAALLDEIALRLTNARVITVGRYKYVKMQVGESVEIAPFSRTETEEYLKRLRVKTDPHTSRSIHRWTSGNPHLLRLAASWIKTVGPQDVARGISSFKELAEVNNFLLEYVTDLLDSDDRALLEAASVFRDRFSDEALAFISDRTRGAVMDAALRLERAYVATRNLEGDSAFFHTSVRDYIYERLEPERKKELHDRAAMWYRRRRNLEEAHHHERRAREATKRAGVASAI